MRFETSVDIAAPAETVWHVLVDVERWPEWTRSMQRVQILGGGALAVGSRVRVKQPGLGSMVYRVTELAPEHSFTWVAGRGGVTATAAHQVSATPGGGVRVRLGVDLTGPLGPLMSVLLGGRTRRYIEMEAQGLERRSETGRGEPGRT